jgi:hypothetical protein
MNSGQLISNLIIEHKTVYEQMGINVPPYRITCKEHKELLDHCKQFMFKTSIVNGEFKVEEFKPTSISVYCGVKLIMVEYL